MKKLGCLGSLIFYLNSLVAFLLLLSFVLPYLPPSKFPTISVLSVGVSPLILCNLVFMFYWLVRMRKQFMLSFIVLLLSVLNFASFIKFNSTTPGPYEEETLRVLSYNVRLFNQYEDKQKQKEALVAFHALLEETKPDLLFLQEFYKSKEVNFSDYQYQYIDYNDSKRIFGHAIYSKYPIIGKGDFQFKGSSNNVLWVDLKVGQDTLRAYNVHLQSMRIPASVAYLQETDTEVIKNKLSFAFVKQESQLAELREHMAASPIKKQIVAGDFNNTTYSYTYKNIRGGLKDAFLEAGRGLGTTFYFDGFPLRIDYILTSEDIKVKYFKTMEETFSDHYPVWADLQIGSN